jgi:alanyl-tRNA synthetase
LSYIQSWEETKKYFEKNGHKTVSRYPVVCRWREDLYYTIASIVDFQRIVDNKVVFELPHNPLVVPQMCLRFNDIENVGISGRHYTSFCMVGQTCNADAEGGYWKDKCIDLDFGLLVDVLGISPNEITFVEDVWIGAGAFGSSLEYFVRGLELGNAVFTEFEGTEKKYRTMKNKIIDMGAGLERFSWITNGTPTSYDCTFEPVLEKIYDKLGLAHISPLYANNPESATLANYFSRVSSKLGEDMDTNTIKRQISKELNIDYEKLQKIIIPYESLFTILDHLKTLIFAISDGSLPSNVGGGYNLRVLLRRSLSILKNSGYNLRVPEIVDLHIDHLQALYPELNDYREDIFTILDIESNRFSETQSRINAISAKIKKENNKLELEDLIRLYESDGITPDHLVDMGLLESVPPNFYTKLSELHSSIQLNKKDKNEIKINNDLDFDSLTKTELIYYQHPTKYTFEAKIIRKIDHNAVILDKTCFYPRGGGQEPDYGFIGSFKVDNVIKLKDIVLHHTTEKINLMEGDLVYCTIDKERRQSITKNHTATHIINQSSQNILGSWVWQNSAFKEESYARLDLTHHSALSKKEIQEIEKKANEFIQKNLPVKINTFDRGIAEQNYGFRIYQGGVVPSNNVRIVNIGGLDIEACGGTHVFNTGEIGLIKILKTERIQDGVVRLEFVSGENAIKHIQKQEDQLQSIVTSLGTSKEKVLDTFSRNLEDFEKSKKKIRNIIKSISEVYLHHIQSSTTTFESKPPANEKLKLFYIMEGEMDEEFHLAIGQYATERDADLIYVSVINSNNSAKVISYCGKNASIIINAGLIAKSASTILGGSGGGSANFGQGGGRSVEKISKIKPEIEKLIKEKIE